MTEGSSAVLASLPTGWYFRYAMNCSAAMRLRKNARAVAVALACLVVAFSVVTGLVQANSRYFYCESMGLMRVDPCVAGAQRDESPPAQPRDEISRTPFTCCATGVFGQIPSGVGLEVARVAPAPLVALAGTPPTLGDRTLSPAQSPAPLRLHRLRIPPRPARELRAKSTIFLT